MSESIPTTKGRKQRVVTLQGIIYVQRSFKKTKTKIALCALGIIASIVVGLILITGLSLGTFYLGKFIYNLSGKIKHVVIYCVLGVAAGIFLLMIILVSIISILLCVRSCAARVAIPSERFL